MTSCLQDVIHNSSSKVLTKIVKFTLSSRLHLAIISALYSQKNFLIFYLKIRMTHFDAFSKIESKVTTCIFQKSYKWLFEKKNLFTPIIWSFFGKFWRNNHGTVCLFSNKIQKYWVFQLCQFTEKNGDNFGMKKNYWYLEINFYRLIVKKA